MKLQMCPACSKDCHTSFSWPRTSIYIGYEKCIFFISPNLPTSGVMRLGRFNTGLDYPKSRHDRATTTTSLQTSMGVHMVYYTLRAGPLEHCPKTCLFDIVRKSLRCRKRYHYLSQSSSPNDHQNFVSGQFCHANAEPLKAQITAYLAQQRATNPGLFYPAKGHFEAIHSSSCYDLSYPRCLAAADGLHVC